MTTPLTAAAHPGSLVGLRLPVGVDGAVNVPDARGAHSALCVRHSGQFCVRRADAVRCSEHGRGDDSGKE